MGRQPEFFSWATNHSPQNVILSTVAAGSASEAVQQWAQRFNYLELHTHTRLPIQNRYRTPGTLGKDRIAAVTGAYALKPSQDCLVVDAGTCITFDYLSRDGAYIGGNIAPGLRMRLRAMHEFTARLPHPGLQETEDWVGASTEEALRNGAQFGAAMELDGYIREGEARFGPLQVFLTGGDADFLAKKVKRKIFVNHHLVLFGLNQILDYNVKHLE